MDRWGQLSLFPDAPENAVLENRPLMSLEEMRKHEWCVSWSGGKDSTATILLMREYGIPIKQITYVRMMWDETTPATLPIMTEFVDESTERLRLWGYSVVIVPSVLALVLPAYYNTADEFVKEEEQPIFFMKMEEELNRIIHEELKDNILDAAELTAFKIEEIRKKWGMITYENE